MKRREFNFMVTNKELIEKAKSVVKSRKIKHGCTVGDVGSALVTEKGNMYLGVSIDTTSGMGFCGEHNAIGTMITNGELKIKKIVAVLKNGTVLPPCGRCREFINQIHKNNINTEIILSKTKTVKLKKLLPNAWS
jgi:cytidine deaminase